MRYGFFQTPNSVIMVLIAPEKWEVLEWQTELGCCFRMMAVHYLAQEAVKCFASQCCCDAVFYSNH
jgi:hypothetical protein